VQRLRGERGALGLVTGNGWYVTKHSAAVYSTDPPRGEWRRTDPAIDQAQVDGGPRPAITEAPSGVATVETYTVVFDRDGAPEMGIIIGRTSDGARFIANTPSERRLLESMTKREMVGAAGSVVTAEDGRSIFTPA
jgi:acetyl-CoA C-acetyltransferase